MGPTDVPSHDWRLFLVFPSSTYPPSFLPWSRGKKRRAILLYLYAHQVSSRSFHCDHDIFPWYTYAQSPTTSLDRLPYKKRVLLRFIRRNTIKGMDNARNRKRERFFSDNTFIVSFSLRFRRRIKGRGKNERVKEREKKEKGEEIGFFDRLIKPF